EEGGSCRGRRFAPDSAAHFVEQFLHYRQPGAGALEVLLPHQPVEQSKNAVVVLHVEPNSVISNLDKPRIASLMASDANRRWVHMSAVLQRIFDQVGQDLQQTALPRVDDRCGEADGHFGALIENCSIPIPQNNLDYSSQ